MAGRMQRDFCHGLLESAHYNAPMRIRSSAPARIDLAGGTLDIWPLYLFHEGARTLNAAITVRAECELSDAGVEGIRVTSEDTGAVLAAASSAALTGEEEPRLAARLLRYFRVDRVAVVTRSQSPVGAGLAGSSALNIALCGALAAWQDRSFEPEELIALAQDLEVQVIRVPTGGQDYRPAVYGGIASLELGPAGVRRRPLPVAAAELSARIVLAYTGDARNSGVNNWEITKRHLDGDRQVFDALGRISAIAGAMERALELGDWPAVGRHLSEEWAVRKSLAPNVTTPAIDALIDAGLAAGASGAKVCGAGGGGCILLLAEPQHVGAVRAALAAAGARLLDAAVDEEGLRVRRV